ncbi:MAG: ThuA domain-containing protein [Novosphingobium sp.]
MALFRNLALAVTSAAALCAAPLAARPVTDCPLRDAPFSIDSPLIDIFLSPQASDATNTALGGLFEKLQPTLASTKTPTFSAIITLRSLGDQLKPEALAALDAQLRKLPVTPADKVARCARYDNDVPRLDLAPGKPRILLFEKINGFKDAPSVNAAHEAFIAMARRKGWSIVSTESGGAFNSATLARFDVVIWNNISGDVLSLSQRKAFQKFLTRGGGFIAVHGSAGDPAYFWDWYADKLIGARFKAHPMNPQFQEARIIVDKAHPLARVLPADWRMTDEWYSFTTNPRANGAKVLLTLDESTYSPVGPKGVDLRMSDHPIAWTNCIGKGRMFYSAIGHRPEAYSQPEHVALLEEAITWAADQKPKRAAGSCTF